MLRSLKHLPEILDTWQSQSMFVIKHFQNFLNNCPLLHCLCASSARAENNIQDRFWQDKSDKKQNYLEILQILYYKPSCWCRIQQEGL